MTNLCYVFKVSGWSYQSLLLLLDEEAREFTVQGQRHSRLTEILIVDMTFVNVNYQIIWLGRFH